MAQQVVQLHQLDAELRCPRRHHVRVVGDEPDVEGGEALRDQLTDLPEADDADGLAVELDNGVRAAFPLPGAQLASAAGMCRAAESSSATACSAAETMFDVGALTTMTPRAVAAGTSTLSSPTPARATTLSRRAAASASASTFVAERTSRASASASAEWRRAVCPVDVADVDVVAEQRDGRRCELLGEQDDGTADDGGAHGGAVLPDRWTDRRPGGSAMVTTDRSCPYRHTSGSVSRTRGTPPYVAFLPTQLMRPRSFSPTCSIGCSWPSRWSLQFGAVALGDPLPRERAVLDLAEDLLHLGLRGGVDDARAAGQVAVLRGVRDREALVGDSALVHEVDDQLELVQALEVRDLRA